MKLSVYSEIGRLRKVLLHRPGKELEQLTPERLDKLLFDDIPYLKAAQREHDAFADALRENGVEVLYLKDLMAETLSGNVQLRKSFIRDFIKLSGPVAQHYEKELFKFLMDIESDSELVEKTMTGVSLKEIKKKGQSGFAMSISRDDRFAIDPSPNLYFTRDPFACIGRGVSFSRMYSHARQRETLYGSYIMREHSLFKGNVPAYYEQSLPFSIEGGDILNLGGGVLAVGISQRTEPEAIEILAQKLLLDEESGYKKVVAINIPSIRAYMHLDTVFTQLNENTFTIHPSILPSLRLYELSLNKRRQLRFTQFSSSFDRALAKVMDKDRINLIYCGGDDPVASEREQWNDGSNTLCIAPNKVVVYDRNSVTNDIFKAQGISTIEIPSSELARGRGGPRCMSMPLERD